MKTSSLNKPKHPGADKLVATLQAACRAAMRAHFGIEANASIRGKETVSVPIGECFAAPDGPFAGLDTQELR